MTKDKRQKTGGMLKGLIKTGGKVADKAIDKGGDLAGAMMERSAALISKLSDDIGTMADRILTMEERIGLMADRIVKTEELLARLTAAMADKQLELPAVGAPGNGPSHAPVLSLGATEVSRASPPDLQISGDPAVYLLHVSTSPRFAEGSTVISRVATPEERAIAWQRSLTALAGASDDSAGARDEAVCVCVAVKAIDRDQRVSPLSNSVDLTLHSFERS
jgi:hypothetical protein